MKLAVVGISHKELMMDARHHFSFTDTQKLEFASLLLEHQIEQCIILSTCNRSEVYIMSEADEVICLKKRYQEFCAYSDSIYTYQGDEAIKHLLRVACGLESMLVREDQILGQVKSAYDFARERQLGGKEIYMLFQETIHFVKTIKTEFAQPSLSLSHVAIEYLKKKIHLENKKIMLVGAGEVALSCLPYLYPHNTIYMMNRTSKHMQDISIQYPQIHCLPFEERISLLKDMDVLISATASPHLIFRTDDFKQTHLIAIDLAMPRDIEKNQYIECIDLEDLEHVIMFNNQQRTKDEEQIMKRIEEMTIILEKKLSSIQNDYMIQSLQTKSLELADQTYHLLIQKLDLSTKEKYILEKTLKASFLQMIREPIHCIKNNEINDFNIIHQLFDIKEVE